MNLQQPSDLILATNFQIKLGELLVDAGRLLVIGPDSERSIAPKALAVLAELARHAGRTVTREQFLDTVWIGSCPTPDALTHAVKELRKALGDDHRAPRFIETVPRLGYRLIADVLWLEPSTGRTQAPELPRSAAVGIPMEEPVEAPVAAPVAAPKTESEAQQPSPIGAHPIAWSRRVFQLAPLLLVLLTSVATAMWWSQQENSAQAEPGTNEIGLTAEPGWEVVPTVAPDGSAVAYMSAKLGSAQFWIHVRTVGAMSGRRLSSIEGDDIFESMPAWSNDGRHIAFSRHSGRNPAICQIIISDVVAGRERALAGCPSINLEFRSWTHDDEAILIAQEVAAAGVRGRQLARLDVKSGGMELLNYARSDGDVDLDPRQSPDGKWIAFRRGANPYADLYVMRSDGSDLRQLTRWALPITRYSWLPDSSQLLVARQGVERSLLRISLDGGDPSDSIDGHRLPAEAVHPDVARNGNALVYARYRTSSRIVSKNLNAEMPTFERQVESSRSEWDPAISPDGSTLAFVSDRRGVPELLLSGTEPDATPRVIAQVDGARPRSLRWSSDGSRLAYVMQGMTRSEGHILDLASNRSARIGHDQELVRSIDFAREQGLIVSSNRSGDWNLWLVSDVSWTSLGVQGGIRGSEAPDGSLIFSREADPRLYRRERVDSETTQVLIDDLWMPDEGAWNLHQDGVYAVRANSPDPILGHAIAFMPWRSLPTGTWQKAFNVPENFLNRNFSITADASVVYSAEQSRREADIYMWKW
jgi:Tol biopolymer transport system component/DNA-binding winged helix-turn-helix (wHTH) protein